jgi:NADH-quinone oxidoreductase subunit A
MISYIEIILIGSTRASSGFNYHYDGIETVVSTPYATIIIYIIVAIALSMVIFALSLFVATQSPDSAKRSAYECGFEAFTDSRIPFDIRFYLVGILFIVFDLEAAFMYPWAANIGHMDSTGFYSMMDFAVELVAGLSYVWMVGSLDW